ncbi:MAG: OsmC family protein, partial [Candidatus Omnitrophica bacterium]|nr:OsmC family protein [Candidatus Omnitrophota bacterium]
MGDIKPKSKKFVYKTKVSWVKEKKGILSSSGKPDIEIAVPPEFKGHENIWTPEELFVASVNACIKTTFLYYAQKQSLEFLSYESEAEGILKRIENRFIFTEIKIMPKIRIIRDSQIEKAKEIITLSEKSCLISNSIKSKVEVLP